MPGPKGESKRSGDSPKVADLLRIVEDSEVDLFHDQRGDAFGRLRLPQGPRIIPVRANEFDEWLSRLAWERLNWPPGIETLKTVKRQLEFKAKFDGPQHRLHVRVANHDGALWVDLDGRKAVRIVPGNWDIVTDPPVLFRSYPHQAALPVPVRGGDPWEVFSVLNFHDQAAQLLFLVWMVTGFIPDIPIPAMVLFGPPGSVKTTTLKIAKRLIDPGHPEVHGRMRNRKDFAQIASQNRVLILDNLTSISDDLSDALSGAITGEGEAKRELYSDEDSVVFEFRCVVGLAGINLIPEKADLANRSITLRLPPVPPDRRILERELNRRFEEIGPTVLGGLFDALSNALMIEKYLDFKELPRMADFASIGGAVAEALGRDKNTFLGAYEGNVAIQYETILESDTVAQLLIRFMSDSDFWEGTASELKDSLEALAKSDSMSLHGRKWPITPNHLSGRLSYLEQPLRSVGIIIERPQRSGDRRPISIRRVKTRGGKPDDACDGTHDGQV